MMGYFLYHFLETLKWPFPILVSTLSNGAMEFIGQRAPHNFTLIS